MQTTNSNYEYSNTFLQNYQLFLPMELSVKISDDSPVKVLSNILEGLDYGELRQVYFNKKGRRCKIDPVIMFKLLAYANYDGIFSSRDIEKSCKENINYMWILQRNSAPDHNTINRFIRKAENQIENLFYQFTHLLIQMDEVSLENAFIDGSKFEANANKYGFVWKKSVLRFYDKLKEKALEFLIEFNEKNNTHFHDVYQIKEYLEDIAYTDGLKLISEKRKRKTKIQKYYETTINFIMKDMEYSKKLKICGDRNSYSKTDNDATFMRMKEDYMRNGQLKPAYNVQIAVSSEYIVAMDLFPNPTDVRTLKPFLNLMSSKGLKYKNIIADAGYESEENYFFLKENEYTPYIKPQTYEKQKTKRFKNDISKHENMEYIATEDKYICHNNKELNCIKIYNSKNKSGFSSEKRIYQCESCGNCPVKDKCNKKEDDKTITVSRRFIDLRNESYRNITSEEGIILRMNRSIQVEGAFGIIKQDIGFRRFKYRGAKQTKIEFLLLALGFNLRKFISKQKKDRKGVILHKIPVA